MRLGFGRIRKISETRFPPLGDERLHRRYRTVSSDSFWRPKKTKKIDCKIIPVKPAFSLLLFERAANSLIILLNTFNDLVPVYYFPISQELLPKFTASERSLLQLSGFRRLFRSFREII